MVQMPLREPPLTEEQIIDFFMLMLDDDTEEAPWLTLGDLQFRSASGFAHSLRNHARAQALPWYVAVTVRTATFYTRTKIRKLDAPTTDSGVITAAALRILDLFELDRPIRLLGVRLELEMPP